MKTLLMAAIVVFVASLASIGSGLVAVIGAVASAAWIAHILRYYDRLYTVDIEEVDKDV